LEDSRQKPKQNAHIKAQLEALGYKVERSKLYVGDYQLANSGSIVVDTKQNLQELCGNVVQGHERFRAECTRAQEAGIKLIILVTDPKIKRLSDVFGWFNPRRIYSKTATSGRTLGKILYSMRDKYGVQFEFCTKEEVGSRIIELLGGDPDD
jgi:ERCC4-type nuclease